MADVLVVDDDDTVRRLVCDVLELEGHHVVAMPDGPSSLAYLRSMRPDCVLLDVMMPGQDGFDVLARIRDQPVLADLPVALLTAAADDATVWRGWQSGASWFFNKPIDVDALRGFVGALSPGRQRSPAPATSPYELAAARQPAGEAVEATLVEMIRALESQALLHGTGQLIMVSVPGPTVLRDSRMLRLEELAASGNEVVVLGRRLPRRVNVERSASLVPLRQDDRLQQELVHLVAGPKSTSLLVARAADGFGGRWSFVLSHDVPLVGSVAEQLLARVPHLALAVPELPSLAAQASEG